jgi:hypothetical protein
LNNIKERGVNKVDKNEESEGITFLRDAYEYLSQKGFEEQVNEIRASKDSYGSYTSTLRRGKIVDLLEKNNLLEDFIEQY